jgi:hypothetical protein
MARGVRPAELEASHGGVSPSPLPPHAPDETGGFIGVAYGAGGAGGVPPSPLPPHAPDETGGFIGER